jgi:hypothetical protein
MTTDHEICSKRLLTVGDLFTAGCALKYQQLRRTYPDASEDELTVRFGSWMLGRGSGAEHRSLSGDETFRAGPPRGSSRLLLLLKRVHDDLALLDQPSALVGALAVSTWTDMRFGRDMDLAVAVRSDAAAESLVDALGHRDYVAIPEQTRRVAGRLIFARLVPSDEDPQTGIVVDLLFASSGIEREIVMAAEDVEAVPGLHVPVARPGHLVAMKVLALSRHRAQDEGDLRQLLENLSSSELSRAREAIGLIEARGFNRGKSLNTELDAFIASLQ